MADATFEYFVQIEYELYEPERRRFKTRESFFRKDGKNDSVELERAIRNRWYDLQVMRRFEMSEELTLKRVEITPPERWTDAQVSVVVQYVFTSTRPVNDQDDAFSVAESVEPFVASFSTYPLGDDLPFTFFLRTRKYTMSGKSTDVGFVDTLTGRRWSRGVY